VLQAVLCRTKAIYGSLGRNPQHGAHSNLTAGFSSSFFPRLFNPSA
jgi:hypothetical protein